MNKKIELLTHNGKEVVFSDYSGLCGPEFVETIMSHHRQHRTYIEGCKEMLVLTDVTNCCHDAEVGTAFKQTVKANQPHIKRSAVLGTVGTQRILLQAINMFSRTDTRMFDTREEALEWLTS